MRGQCNSYGRWSFVQFTAPGGCPILWVDPGHLMQNKRKQQHWKRHWCVMMHHRDSWRFCRGQGCALEGSIWSHVLCQMAMAGSYRQPIWGVGHKDLVATLRYLSFYAVLESRAKWTQRRLPCSGTTRANRRSWSSLRNWWDQPSRPSLNVGKAEVCCSALLPGAQELWPRGVPSHIETSEHHIVFAENGTYMWNAARMFDVREDCLAHRMLSDLLWVSSCNRKLV